MLRFVLLIIPILALCLVGGCRSHNNIANSQADPDQNSQEAGSTERHCDSLVSGAWASGSCTGSPIALANDGGPDPLEDLTSSCVDPTGSDCASASGGWQMSDADWYYAVPNPDQRYENINYETVSNTNGDGYDGMRHHIFSVREEDNDGTTTSLPDGPSRAVYRVFEKTLIKGSYKLALDAHCLLIDNDGASWGACDNADYGTLTQNKYLTPFAIELTCDIGETNPLSVLFASVPPYAQKSRFEAEFAVPQNCRRFTLYLYVSNDLDVFETRTANSRYTRTNPFDLSDATYTNAFFRTYIVDNLSLSPLAIGSGTTTANETEKGLADYFQILNRCNDGACGGKTFSLKTDGSVNPYSSANSVYLIGGTSPTLVRKQKSPTGTLTAVNYEILHQAGGDVDAEPIKDAPYFFLSRRPDDVAPWTVPLARDVAAVADGLTLKQVKEFNDTARTWIAVRNPTDSAIAPQFRLPAEWALYSVIYLPYLHKSDYTYKFTAFEIVPDHLVQCMPTEERSGDLQTVSCGEWTLPAGSSRLYVLEVPSLTRDETTSLTLLNNDGEDLNSLPISVELLSQSRFADYSERYTYWGGLLVSSMTPSELEIFLADLAKHHVTDVLTYANMACPSGMACTLDEPAIGLDINGDDILSEVDYLPLERQGTTCTVADEVTASVTNLHHNPSYLTLLKEHNMRLGYAMGSVDNWKFDFTQTLDDKGDPITNEYTSAYFLQHGAANEDVNDDGICDGGGSDIDQNGRPDWNEVVFLDDQAQLYQNEFSSGDIIAAYGAMGAEFYLWPARIREVRKVDLNKLVLYLDVPLPLKPGLAAESSIATRLGSMCTRTGSIYKLYPAGMLNAGIAAATLNFNSLSSAEKTALASYPGIGVCQNVEGLEAINTQRDLGNLHWERQGETITTYCYEGTDRPANQITCELDPHLSDAQEVLLESVANIYKQGMEDDFGYSADDLMFRHSNLYDETQRFLREPGNFNGFGQMELFGVTDVFERSGLRTGNNNVESYITLEKAFRDDGHAHTGMTYTAPVAAMPQGSPLMAELLDYYRDTSNPNHNSIIYSGGYGNRPPFYQRYLMGLMRVKVGQLDDVKTPGALLWGLKEWNSSSGETDPDYLNGDAFKNEIARYVADRDPLDWGNTRYPLAHYGLVRAPDPEDTWNTYGDETTQYSSILEGIHDLWVFKSSTSEAIDVLPWMSTLLYGGDVHVSTCTLDAVLDPTQTWSDDIATEIACYCGDFVNKPECLKE